MKIIAKDNFYSADFGELEQYLTKYKEYEMKDNNIIDDTDSEHNFCEESLKELFYFSKEEMLKEVTENFLKLIKKEGNEEIKNFIKANLN
jgi:urate oxidase